MSQFGNSQSIIHETEFQRQHIRVELPARAEINHKIYEVKNISAGGLAIAGMDERRTGEELPFKLTLIFDDFSIQIDFKARLQHYDASSETAGLSFQNLTSHKFSILAYIIKTFLSGNYVAGNDVLHSIRRNNFIALPSDNDNTRQKPLSVFSKICASLTIALLGVTALLLIGQNIYQHVFLFKTQTAFIESEVKPKDFLSYVIVEMETADLDRIKKVYPVSIKILGTRIYTSGKVIGIRYTPTPSPHSVLKIRTDRNLPLFFAGRPVQATFRRY